MGQVDTSGLIQSMGVSAAPNKKRPEYCPAFTGVSALQCGVLAFNPSCDRVHLPNTWLLWAEPAGEAVPRFQVSPPAAFL